MNKEKKIIAEGKYPAFVSMVDPVEVSKSGKSFFVRVTLVVHNNDDVRAYVIVTLQSSKFVQKALTKMIGERVLVEIKHVVMDEKTFYTAMIREVLL